MNFAPSSPMQLIHACSSILTQLKDVVTQISEEDFVTPSSALSNSSIGQHFRHTIEFFVCLQHGVAEGIINYDRRAHDKAIESDKYVALNTLRSIEEFVASKADDQPIHLQVGYDRLSDDFVTIPTNYFRELTYNIEHAVHHMALIKIGVREVAPYVNLPEGFGVAVSTLRHMDEVGQR